MICFATIVAEYVVGGSVMFHGSYLKNNKSKHVVDILFRDVADVPNDVAPDHVLGSSSVGVRTRRLSPRWATNAILIV